MNRIFWEGPRVTRNRSNRKWQNQNENTRQLVSYQRPLRQLTGKRPKQRRMRSIRRMRLWTAPFLELAPACT